MPKITDTYTLAYVCCETILKELRRFPTIDLIRDRIGVNSPNTIKKAMNAWTEDFAKQYVDAHGSKFECPDVPAVLTDAVYNLWHHTVSEAKRSLTEQDSLLYAQIAQLQHEIEQQQIVLVNADRALQLAELKINDLESRVISINADLDSSQAELFASHQREKDLILALENQKLRQSELISHHQHQQQQDQDWMQRRIFEERDLVAVKSRDKQKLLEDRLMFLNEHYDQALRSQKVVQMQNQQLLSENAKLKEQLSNVSTSALPKHRFKRHRKSGKEN